MKRSGSRQIIWAASGLVVLVFIIGLIFIPKIIRHIKTDILCSDWNRTVLLEAKYGSLENGTYDAILPASDLWGNKLHSKLRVQELLNEAWVSSAGPDGVFETGDDIVVWDEDFHVRKTVKRGIQSISKSFGKGLAQGVIEGVQEETKENLDVVKKKTSDLLGQFKKEENE